MELLSMAEATQFGIIRQLIKGKLSEAESLERLRYHRSTLKMEHRYNLGVKQGLENYFPKQNFEKISPKTSSFVISPVISAR